MLDFLGCDYVVTNNKNEIKNASKLIFPGQGHFEQAIVNLNTSGLIETIKQELEKGKQFLGICLGLQILFEKSEEAPNIEGLGILKGECKKFQNVKTPQIGWNKIKTTKNNSYLDDDFYYFVNSYHVIPDNKAIISSSSDYGIEFCASIEHNNLVALQFHPEKSANAGIRFFKKWINS